MPAAVGSPNDGVRRITRARAFDSQPEMSPDGKRVAFTRKYYLSNIAEDIYSVATTGTPDVDNDLRQITTDPDKDTDVTFAPDGSAIAYTNHPNAGRGDVHVARKRAGTEFEWEAPVNLTNSAKHDGAPAFSPGGDEIAYASDPTADGVTDPLGIFVMSVDGSNQRAMSLDAPASDLSPSWGAGQWNPVEPPWGP